MALGRKYGLVYWNEWLVAGFLGFLIVLPFAFLVIFLTGLVIGVKLWLHGRTPLETAVGFGITTLFSGVLLGRAVKAHMDRQRLRQLESLKPLLMPRDAMLKMIDEYASFTVTLPMAMDGYDDVDVLRARSVAKALPEDFNTLVDIVENPPADLKTGSEYALQWYYEVAALLGEWLKRDVDMSVSRLGPLLEQPNSRATILDAFCYSNSEARIPWLKPLVTQANEFTEVEQSDLINALGVSLTPESVTLLRQLKTSLPECMQSEIDFFLQRVLQNESISGRE